MNEARYPATGLSALLRQGTHALHDEAERAGVVGAMIGGRATREGYALLLANLLPAYRALEAALLAREALPGYAVLAHPAVFRAARIEADLDRLGGAHLKVLPTGLAYEAAVMACMDGRLLAHAYTRHLADLSGGQVLHRLLARIDGIGPDCLTAYEYPEIADLPGFRDRYRAALDEAGARVGDLALVVAEAVEAFRHNIRIAEAVQDAVSSF
jgi:heme oxygenase